MTSKRTTRLSDLRNAGPPSGYPVDVPQGGTWALWLVLVGVAIFFVSAGVVLIVS
jgi:hypothetical protein